MLLSNNKYHLSCAICQKKENISLLPHKHLDGSIAGFIAVCDEHLEKLSGTTIGIDYRNKKEDTPCQ